MASANTDLKTKKNIPGDGTPGPGRPKGMPNKTTALLKDAILKAATEAGGTGGMVGYLKAQATSSPAAFLALLGKVLPMQIAGDPDNPLEVITRVELVGVRPDGDGAA